MESKIEKEFNKLAMDLKNHIRNYTPSTWVVPISDVEHVPLFLSKEVKIFAEFYKNGELKSKLEELSNNTKFPYVQLKPWYIREAINDFFNKGLYKENENN